MTHRGRKSIAVWSIVLVVLFFVGLRCGPEPDPAWRAVPR